LESTRIGMIKEPEKVTQKAIRLFTRREVMKARPCIGLVSGRGGSEKKHKEISE